MSAGPAPRFVIGVAAGGGILLVATFVALYRVAALDLPDALLLTGLLVGLPTLTLAQLPMMAEAVLDRVSAYWGSIGTLAGLGLLGWLVGARSGGPAAIGFTPIGIGALAAWTFALTIAGLGTIVVFRQIGLVLSVQESPILRALLPRSTGERSLFGLLSIAAGVGEEVAYRGYAIPVLAPLVGPAGAVAVTSAVFGVLHTYQGALGIGRTATMGAVLAWGFLASGSLIPSIIAHTAIDVIAGIMIAERLMLPESRSGVHEPTSPETEHRA